MLLHAMITLTQSVEFTKSEYWHGPTAKQVFIFKHCLQQHLINTYLMLMAKTLCLCIFTLWCFNTKVLFKIADISIKIWIFSVKNASVILLSFPYFERTSCL